MDEALRWGLQTGAGALALGGLVLGFAWLGRGDPAFALSSAVAFLLAGGLAVWAARAQ